MDAGKGAATPGLAAAELVGEEELFAELVGAKVLAEVLETLLQGEEGGGDGLGVGEGDVAPHAVGAGAEAGGLAEGAATDGGDLVATFRVGAEGVFEQRGEGGREHLREMADPGAELVVTAGIEVEGAGAEAGDEGAPLLFERRGLGLLGERSEKPDSVAGEGGLGESGAAGL